MFKLILRAIKSLMLRAYALAIIFVVVWATYVAVAYLFRSVFQPAMVPPDLAGWEARLDAESLRAEGVAGVSGPARRAPIGHYHGVDRWFQPDVYNSCTVSDCHSPTPHQNRVVVRAFANFHATFLTCQMCHLPPRGKTVNAVWVDIATGRERIVPAILQLIKLTHEETEEVKENQEKYQSEVLALLTETIEVMGGDATLEYLLIQIETSESRSPVWTHAMERLRWELPLHLRGEYGAKLAPKYVAKKYRDLITSEKKQVRQYASKTITDDEREKLHKVIHTSIVEQPKGCVTCHNDDKPRIDYRDLGYTKDQARRLRTTPLARQMGEMLKGKKFHMPRFLEDADDH